MTAGLDDDTGCVEHVWGLGQVHLSVTRGVEKVEHCGRCGAVRYVTDDARTSPRRPALPETKRYRGE